MSIRLDDRRHGAPIAAMLLFACCLLHGGAAVAQIGKTLNFQGYLNVPATGLPVNGNVNLVLQIYDVASGGSPLYTETQNNVPVDNGVFNVVLGSVTPLTLPFDKPYFLGVTAGADAEMTPRKPLAASPYAFTALYTAYKGVLVVTTSGGQFNTIGAALASITDNAPGTRYLVYVAPGTYSEAVSMKPYVDIQGAGQGMTKISAPCTAVKTAGTVVGASNAELRELSVETVPSNSYCNAIFNDGASPRITRVTATATGGPWQVGVYNINGSAPTLTGVSASASNAGLATANGVRNETAAAPTLVDSVVTGSSAAGEGMVNVGASATLDRVTVSATAGPIYGGTGIVNDSSALTIRNSTISGQGGAGGRAISNTAASGAFTVTITGSRLVGATNAILNDAHFTTRVAASQLDGGPAAANGGVLVCAGVWDEAFVFSASTCP